MMSFCLSADTTRPRGTNRIVAWSGIPHHAQYQIAIPNCNAKSPRSPKAQCIKKRSLSSAELEKIFENNNDGA
jgi:hypothetical protein